MNKTIGLLILSCICLPVIGQFPQIEDAMSRGKQKGIRIHLDTFQKTVANDAVVHVMSEKDHKVSPTILSFNELFFDNISISSIPSNPIDMYAKIREVDSSIVIFTDLGTTFLDQERHAREGKAIQQIASEIRAYIREIYRLQNIDSLKKKIRATELLLERATDDLKAANNLIKNNIKAAAASDRTIVETEVRLQDEKAQIKAIDSVRGFKEKEFYAFPLAQLKAVSDVKGNALEKNRNIRKNLIKNNLRSNEKILEYETELQMNKSALDVAKDDPKATKKLMKANQQLNTKINEEKLSISMNDASLKTLNSIITKDSVIFRSAGDSLTVFDENGRRKEMRQMDSKKEKLLASIEKHRQDIDRNRLESEQKKKEAEETAKKLDGLKTRETELSTTLEKYRTELAALVKK